MSKIKHEGLVKIHFSNGSEWDCFSSRCDDCRHNIDFNDADYPRAPKLSPPHNICTWGILDRIYYCMATDAHGYGNSLHSPDDMEIVHKFFPHCKRYTHKDDFDGEFREPPTPDIPGQMTFDDIDVPVEINPLHKETSPLNNDSVSI